MLMPAIAQMRASTKIVLVCRSPALDFLRPYVYQCIDYEGPGWHQLFLKKHNVGQPLSVPKVDSVVAFLSDPDGVVSKNLKNYIPGTSVHLFPAFPPEEGEIHVAFYLSECLRRTGLPIDPAKSLKAACNRALLERGVPAIQQERIVFHPGSGGQGKNHPPDFWLELIKGSGKGLFKESNRFILLLGPAEERLHPFFITTPAIKRIETVFSPEKEYLISLLKQARLYIGHDSGITHLAAMLGTPTIALFKNSSVSRWRPLGPAVRVIESTETQPGLIGEILKEARELMGMGHLSSTISY